MPVTFYHHSQLQSLCSLVTRNIKHLQKLVSHPVSVTDTTPGGAFFHWNVFATYNDYITSGFTENLKSREWNIYKTLSMTQCKYYWFWCIMIIFITITKNKESKFFIN